jgi:hypothetical protein
MSKRGMNPKPRSTGLPPGPNPAAQLPLRVNPFGKVFALVEGLGVISLHNTREEGEAALAVEVERRHVLAAKLEALGLSTGQPDHERVNKGTVASAHLGVDTE